MTASSALSTIGSRMMYAGVMIASGVYCLLCSISFVFARFIQPEYSPWLAMFAKWQPLLFALSLAAFIPGFLRPLQQPLARRMARAFAAVHVAAAAALVLFPISRLDNRGPGVTMACLFFGSLIWVAAIDIVEFRNRIDWKDADVLDGPESTALEAMLASWAFLGLLFYTIAAAGAPSIDAGTQIAAFAQTMIAQFVIAMIAVTALMLLCGISTVFARRGWCQFILAGIATAAILAACLHGIVLAAVSFRGWNAGIVSLVAAAGTVGCLWGLTLRLNAGTRPVSGLGLAARTLSPGTRSARFSGISVIAFTAAATVLMEVYLPPYDYNRTFETFAVPLVCLLTFAGFYTLFDRPRIHIHFGILYSFPLAGMVMFFVWSGWSGGTTATAYLRNVHSSFRLAETLLARTVEAADEDSNFYALLQRNTNIPSTRMVQPVSIKLSERTGRNAADRPNIFIIVVDSLRKDYLSPYNSGVTFTPSIQAFARESAVFRNAFTHYGATGLSEPSLWVGGLMLHKQYITPFYPMNSLERLLHEEGYRNFISRDTVLDDILKPDPSAVNLDEGVANRDYRLCRSLGRLSDSLQTRSSEAGPVFAYTQPQDIHVSIINHETRSVPAGESYDGFDGAYASRLRRMDECFGSFISRLKAAGLYDRSIVILTSDHGDSLGEEGRFGHAYTLFPEIVRIPLLVHLPSSIRKRVQWDAQAVAFLSDLTPSLYYLLGRRPIVRHPVLGRPLFTDTLDEQRPYLQDHHLLASSYGPVWGILRENGRYLYIADGVNYTDYFFDLHTDPNGRRNLISDPLRSEYRPLVERGIRSLNEYYGYDAGN